MKYRMMIGCCCLAHLLIVGGMCLVIGMRMSNSCHSLDCKVEEVNMTKVSVTNSVESLDWFKFGSFFIW